MLWEWIIIILLWLDQFLLLHFHPLLDHLLLEHLLAAVLGLQRRTDARRLFEAVQRLAKVALLLVQPANAETAAAWRQ